MHRIGSEVAVWMQEVKIRELIFISLKLIPLPLDSSIFLALQWDYFPRTVLGGLAGICEAQWSFQSWRGERWGQSRPGAGQRWCQGWALITFWTWRGWRPSCLLHLGEGAGAGAGLLLPSPSFSARLPTLLLFVLHMPGPRSAQTVEISFAENYTSDQNVS